MKPKFSWHDNSFMTWLTRERKRLREQGDSGISVREVLLKAGVFMLILGLIKLIGSIYFSN